MATDYGLWATGYGLRATRMIFSRLTTHDSRLTTHYSRLTTHDSLPLRNGLLQCLNDAILVRLAEIRMHRKADDSRARAFRNRKIARTVAEIGKHRLHVQRDRIVHRRRDASRLHTGLDLLALLDL